jgi:hypothetical protein
MGQLGAEQARLYSCQVVGSLMAPPSSWQGIGRNTSTLYGEHLEAVCGAKSMVPTPCSKIASAHLRIGKPRVRP